MSRDEHDAHTLLYASRERTSIPCSSCAMHNVALQMRLAAEHRHLETDVDVGATASPPDDFAAEFDTMARSRAFPCRSSTRRSCSSGVGGRASPSHRSPTRSAARVANIAARLCGQLLCVLRLLSHIFTRQSATKALRTTDSEASHGADCDAAQLLVRLVVAGPSRWRQPMLVLLSRMRCGAMGSMFATARSRRHVRLFATKRCGEHAGRRRRWFRRTTLRRRDIWARPVRLRFFPTDRR